MGNYAYGRVSARDQNLARQIEAFEKVNVQFEKIYFDKESGENFQRTNYQKMIRRLRENDVLYVKSIDRLGRNYNEILEQWKYLINNKGADIVVLDMPILDTRYSKDLIGTFLSDVVLQVLSFVAENERVNLKIRQAEGIAAAKRRGVQFGRPKKMSFSDFEKKYQDLKEQGYRHCDMWPEMGISNSTFYRYYYIFERSDILK